MIEDSEQTDWFKNQLKSAALVTFTSSALVFFGYVIFIPGKRGWDEIIAFGIGLLLGSILSTRRMPDPLKVAPLFNRQEIKSNLDEPYVLISKFWEKFPKYLSLMACFLYLMAFLLITIFSVQSDEITRIPISSIIGGIIVSAALCPSVFFLFAYYSFPD